MRTAYRFIAPLLLLLWPLTANAQRTPAVEMFGGYSHLVADVDGTSFDLNGVDASATENLNSWFGGILDFNAQFGTEAGAKVNTQSIMYGPIFSYRKSDRVVPFGDAMLGAVRGSADYLNISQSEYKFGLAAGGGVDVGLTDRVAFRVKGEYLMTRFSAVRQDNVRFSAGLVFRFGHR